MATKGTPQYNVWKAKYNAAMLRKAGQQSLFSEEQVNSLISATIGDLPKAEVHPLNYYAINTPRGLKYELWQKAAKKATKDGAKEVSFGAVRAIYNVYLKREKEAAIKAEEDAEMAARIQHMLFCCARAENELALEESFK